MHVRRCSCHILPKQPTETGAGVGEVGSLAYPPGSEHATPRTFHQWTMMLCATAVTGPTPDPRLTWQAAGCGRRVQIPIQPPLPSMVLQHEVVARVRTAPRLARE